MADRLDFAFLLVILGLGLVFGLYILVGALRWLDGRPAINNHARVHLGWLLAALALTLMWGYLLEPFELVAGMDGMPDRAVWRATTLVAPLLAGVALATALLSIDVGPPGAPRARRRPPGSSSPLASLLGHWMVPPTLGGEGEPITDQRTLDQFERLAYGLETLSEMPAPRTARSSPPGVPSLWNREMVKRELASDSTDVVSVDPALIAVSGRRRPVWLATRALPGGHLVVSALADDRTGPGGEALFYRPQDSVAVPFIAPLLDLGPGTFHGRAPGYRIGGDDGPGAALDGWPQRVVLAWALQAPDLLGSLPRGARVDWALTPAQRLEQLAPFAAWGEPVARLVDGELLWMVDGYLPAAAFPLAPRADWRRRRVAGLRGALVGVVSAQSGVPHVYLRPGSDALASAWAAIAEGVVEPAASIPDAVWRAAPYPAELFQVQARQLDRPSRKLGSLSGRTNTDAADLPRPEVTWSGDTAGPGLTAAYERADERRLSALLVARHDDGADELLLARVDSASALPSRAALESRWARFPSYDALGDSIRDEGGRLERGPVRFDLDDDGLVAYQSHFGGSLARRPVLVWVTLATGDRQGAGRTLREAWSNLLGASVPTFAGEAETTRLEEARRWLLRADSALRSADWDGFGRAWSSLQRSLGLPSDSGAP